MKQTTEREKAMEEEGHVKRDTQLDQYRWCGFPF